MNIFAKWLKRKEKTNQHPDPRFSGLFRVLWLVPFLTVGYVGWMNLSPTGGTFTYYINSSDGDGGGLARITTVDGLSQSVDSSGTSVSNVVANPVNFELESSSLQNASEVSVEVRFKDTLPEDGNLALGAQNTSGNYTWSECYVPFYKQLTELPLVTRNGDLAVYSAKNYEEGNFKDFDDFLQNAPAGSVVATNEKGLQSYQKAGLQEPVSPIISVAANMQFAQLTENSSYLDLNTSLRGEHEFYFFNDGSSFEFTLTKLDLNWYVGDDRLNILVYSLDGAVKASFEIVDDGDVTQSYLLGFPQIQTFKMNDLERGAYRLVVKSVDKRNDFVISHLLLNRANLVISGKVHLAGQVYLGDESGPMEIWAYLMEDGSLTLTTSHKPALQSVTITGDNYQNVINIDTLNKDFSTETLKAGIYEITCEVGDVVIKSPSVYFAFNRESIFTPTSSSNGMENGDLVINTSLRGDHIFWTYVNNGRLDLTVDKQDLNWYEKADSLAIKIFSPSGELVTSGKIPDDGDESKGRNKGPIQTVNLTLADAQPGAYRIEMKGGQDFLLRRIQINQEKMVAEAKTWVVGMNSSYFDSGLSLDPVSLYGSFSKAGQLSAFSYHNSGLQPLNISGEDFEETLDVSKLNTDFSIDMSSGSYNITVPKQNILVKTDGYFSFTPESFFLPQSFTVIGLKYDLAWLREHADYVVVNTSAIVVPAVEKDGWLVARATWKIEDLLVEGSRLHFALSFPHLETEPELVVPIDTIKIQVKIFSLNERLSMLNLVSDKFFLICEQTAIWRTDLV